ncbi:homoserine lactone transporter [Bacterioplanes sanyensis]|uniref:Homoserine lactone transporter n=1 Tax=Bacterioplanes sanyensis TaxID=1249553 RepID=A0A222FL54_9GAMM|nr:LysE family translocator [Bacterioplanes sanyensis]ASP39510.1 homoserine lactone transporter [Bacterioplanes sanyensis]
MNELLAFAVIATLLVMSPGPNGVLIVKTATAQGKSASMMNIIGLFLATFVHGALSIFGLSALVLQSAELFMLVKVLGAAYLFYIGAKAIWQSLQRPNDTTDAPVIDTQTRSARYYFSEGFLTQLLNPKVSVFYLAAFPQFIDPASFSYMSAFALVALHASIIFVWFTAMTHAIARVKSWSRHSSLGTWVQRLSGSVMIYFSALVLTQRS